MFKSASKVKMIIADCLLKILPGVNRNIESGYLKSLEKRAHMFVLQKRDIFQWRVDYFRGLGAKIGERCKLFSFEINSEPFLVEIGNHVVIADSVRLITHDGGVWLFWDEHPEIDNYGKIKIGNNVFIGMDAIILPNTTIGDNCVIGAGSVVRGKIPDDSVVMGNPAQVIMKTSLYKKMILSSRKTLPTALIPLDKEGWKERYRIIKHAFNLD